MYDAPDAVDVEMQCGVTELRSTWSLGLHKTSHDLALQTSTGLYGATQVRVL